MKSRPEFTIKQLNLPEPSTLVVKTKEPLKPQGIATEKTEAALQKLAVPMGLTPNQLRIVMDIYPNVEIYPSMATLIKSYMDDGMKFENALERVKSLEGT